ncbi:MAG: hypothetical protein FWF12_06960 [Betaproteobacteria bacterium]|nr:hypothetical protein [Betaproteobacteria bacterium]
MKTFPFKPDLRIFQIEDTLVVTFDSRCPFDATRSLHSVRVPVDYQMMSVKVSNFADKVDSDGMRRICGTIHLVVTDKEGREEALLLSDCTMTFVAPMQKSLPLYEQLVTPSQVANTVCQGVSEALNAALHNLLQDLERTARHAARFALKSTLSTTEAEPKAPGTFVRRPSPISRFWVPPANDEQSPTWKKRLKFATIVVGAGILTWVVMGSYFSNQPPREKAAVAAAMNPQDIDAQIRLTTEVLKEMGLNPGKPQDVGCLGRQ